MLLFGACARRPPADVGDRDTVREELDRWRRAALHPAGIAPPSIAEASGSAERGGVHVRAALVRPEEASWNGWGDGTARLFNDGAAFLVEVSIEADGPVSWSPVRTILEVNDARLAVAAAPSAEPLLTELLFHAWLEERWWLEGDLSERARAAGPFRAAYLPSRSEDGHLAGIIAFPLGEHARDHVVALRLTLALEVGGEPTEARIVFD